MISINVVCVGKLKEQYLLMASAEYLKRLQGFCKVQVVELSEYKVPNQPSQAQIDQAIQKEGVAIGQQLDKFGGQCVALCIEGKMQSSEQLAQTVEQIALGGVSTINFVIGGSFGLCETVKKRGMRLSMSPMTFPHQLARVMLLEQIYRAFQISSGGKYHK